MERDESRRMDRSRRGLMQSWPLYVDVARGRPGKQDEARCIACFVHPPGLFIARKTQMGLKDGRVQRPATGYYLRSADERPQPMLCEEEHRNEG